MRSLTIADFAFVLFLSPRTNIQPFGPAPIALSKIYCVPTRRTHRLVFPQGARQQQTGTRKGTGKASNKEGQARGKGKGKGKARADIEVESINCMETFIFVLMPLIIVMMICMPCCKASQRLSKRRPQAYLQFIQDGRQWEPASGARPRPERAVGGGAPSVRAPPPAWCATAPRTRTHPPAVRRRGSPAHGGTPPPLAAVATTPTSRNAPRSRPHTTHDAAAQGVHVPRASPHMPASPRASSRHGVVSPHADAAARRRRTPTHSSVATQRRRPTSASAASVRPQSQSRPPRERSSAPRRAVQAPQTCMRDVETVLQSLPITDVVDSEACPVCLDDMCDDHASRMVRPTCSHIIHRACLQSWLARTPAMSCPVCRTSVALQPHDGHPLTMALLSS